MDRLSAAWVDSYTFIDLGLIPLGQGSFSVDIGALMGRQKLPVAEILE
jgi:hypothetical protein